MTRQDKIAIVFGLVCLLWAWGDVFVSLVWSGEVSCWPPL